MIPDRPPQYVAKFRACEDNPSVARVRIASVDGSEVHSEFYCRTGVQYSIGERQEGISSLALSRDRQKMAVNEPDDRVSLRDASGQLLLNSDGEPTLSKKFEDGKVMSVAFSGDTLIVRSLRHSDSRIQIDYISASTGQKAWGVDVDNVYAKPVQQPSDPTAAGFQGAAVWLSNWLMHESNLRENYARESRDPSTTKAKRDELKQSTYEQQTPIGKSITEELKNDPDRIARAKARAAGASGNPHKTNWKVNAFCAASKYAGAALRAVATYHSLQRMYRADANDRVAVVNREASSWLGGADGGDNGVDAASYLATHFFGANAGTVGGPTGIAAAFVLGGGKAAVGAVEGLHEGGFPSKPRRLHLTNNENGSITVM